MSEKAPVGEKEADMIVIGLTGSIGMGKSTVANMMRQMGIPVHDSDLAVHELLGKGGAGVRPVFLAFPDAYDKQSESIDRRKLRDLLGRDPAHWTQLEQILHPLVQDSQQEFIRAQRLKGVKMAALDIPLLFETGAEKRMDATICVSAPAFIQHQRVMARPGMTEEDFAFRLSRQMPDAEKCKRADFVLQTGVGLAETQAQLQTIIKSIRNKKPERGYRP